MIILDTNVLSEPTRPRPDPAALRWLSAQDSAELFTTTINEAEMLFGIARMPEGARRTIAHDAARALFGKDFADRVLPFDRAAASLFAEIVAQRMHLGKPIGTMDAQIAAIARSQRAAVATRDVEGFEHCGIAVINPWTA
jgi:predicted nucleic acid-binding protein